MLRERKRSMRRPSEESGYLREILRKCQANCRPSLHVPTCHTLSVGGYTMIWCACANRRVRLIQMCA